MLQTIYDQIGIEAWRLLGAMVLAKQGSHQMYNTIPKSREWLIINCVVNVVGTIMSGFYMFKGEWIHDDYIQFYKPRIYMAMQSKAWMTIFLFKKFVFSQKVYTKYNIHNK